MSSDPVLLMDIPAHVGLYFPTFFDQTRNYFDELKQEHQFQTLTESNKPSPSYRKGLYISEVHQVDNDKDVLSFNLLRCSTNLDGPTDEFKQIDREIVGQVNQIADIHFENHANLNHVLAQVYENATVVVDGKLKDKKAKIKAHSDKTKDFPKNGSLIAFCTFYDQEKFKDKNIKKGDADLYDYRYKNASVLTSLLFKLKDCVNDRADLPKEIKVTLHPNSLLLIPLSTNRLYTHEIQPPLVSSENMPTRLGYIIRCSNTIAIHEKGQTYIVQDDGQRIALQQPSDEDIVKLKSFYREENQTDKVVEYGAVNFSLNQGDYQKPLKVQHN